MTTPDIRDASLSELRGVDFRAPGRDTLADMRGVQAIVDGLLDGIPDGEWDRPVSASDVPSAPPWSLKDHVGHVADWNDEAAQYIRPLLDGSGDWPADEAYDSDLDTWNEGRRPLWTARTPSEMRAWQRASADRLLELAAQLPSDAAASDGAWEWVWHNLGPHVVDHLVAAGLGASEGGLPPTDG